MVCETVLLKPVAKIQLVGWLTVKKHLPKYAHPCLRWLWYSGSSSEGNSLITGSKAVTLANNVCAASRVPRLPFFG